MATFNNVVFRAHNGFLSNTSITRVTFGYIDYRVITQTPGSIKFCLYILERLDSPAIDLNKNKKPILKTFSKASALLKTFQRQKPNIILEIEEEC